MKKILITAAALSTFAVASAFAAAPAFEEVDANGNGTISFEELAVVMPDTSQTQFAAADLDGSGELSADEYNKATTKS
jgi:Ca2+-binding EF-hand superfamily protein